MDRSRRRFLVALGAVGMLPAAGWARAGAPDFLSAARFPDGSYRLAGLSGAGEVIFTLPLPDRGHAAAAHPNRPEAVAFARRPGDFAVVLDCAAGREVARITAPKGRHFYGHGVFAAGGDLLFTTENDYEAGEGRVGIWDAAAGYRRMGEFASGGVGPHDMALLPGGRTLVVANGGIETHPDMGRAKLNIPVMRPNLCYLSLDGRVVERVELGPDLHKNSIRHLAVARDGTVGFAMQWQGSGTIHPPLLGLHRRGTPVKLCKANGTNHRRMRGYAGSVAISDGAVAITSPRGGLVQVFDAATGHFLRQVALEDVCGVAPMAHDFFVTSGRGVVGALDGADRGRRDCHWDNHLISIG